LSQFAASVHRELVLPVQSVTVVADAMNGNRARQMTAIIFRLKMAPDATK
jgi:hypothetical protein